MKEPSGNALFLILIAVALFAALSYAVTQSGRGGGDINKEQSLIAAARIIEYGASLRSAITRMVLTGTAVSDLDANSTSTWFTTVGTDHCTTGENCPFAPEGGAAPVESPAGPATAFDSPVQWVLYQIKDGGLFSVAGVGTSAVDVLMISGAFMKLSVCEAINKGLGLAATPQQDDAMTAFIFDAYNGEPFFCHLHFSGTGYQYVHTLVEQ